MLSIKNFIFLIGYSSYSQVYPNRYFIELPKRSVIRQLARAAPLSNTKELSAIEASSRLIFAERPTAYPPAPRVEESMSVDHRQQCNCHDLSHGHHETEPIYIQVKWGLEADETYIGGKSHGTQKLRAETASTYAVTAW
jgi:hypothetical protein